MCSTLGMCTITTRWIQVFCTFSQAIFWQGTVKKLQATDDGCFPMPSFCIMIYILQYMCMYVLKNIPIHYYKMYYISTYYTTHDMSLNWNEKCRLLKNIFILKKDCVTFIHIFSCRLFWHFSTNWRADIFVGSRHLALSKLDVLEDWVWLFGRRRRPAMFFSTIQIFARYNILPLPNSGLAELLYSTTTTMIDIYWE